jgi:hypothetical protein
MDATEKGTPDPGSEVNAMVATSVGLLSAFILDRRPTTAQFLEGMTALIARVYAVHGAENCIITRDLAPYGVSREACRYLAEQGIRMSSALWANPHDSRAIEVEFSAIMAEIKAWMKRERPDTDQIRALVIDGFLAARITELLATLDGSILPRHEFIHILCGEPLPAELARPNGLARGAAVKLYLQVPPPEPGEEELALLKELIDRNAPAAEAAPKLGMVQSEYNIHRTRQHVYGPREVVKYVRCVICAIFGATNATPICFFTDEHRRFLHVADARKVSDFPELSRALLEFGLLEATPFVLGVTVNPADGARLVIVSCFPSHRNQRLAVADDALPGEIFANELHELQWEEHFLQNGVVELGDPLAPFLQTTVASADLALRLRDPPLFVAAGGVCFVPEAEGVSLLGVADSPDGIDRVRAVEVFGFVAAMSSPEQMDKNWFDAFHVCEEVPRRTDDPRDRRKKRAIALGRPRRSPELAGRFERLAAAVGAIDKMATTRQDRFMSVAAVFVDANGPLTDEELADRAGVGINSVGKIMATLREIDPGLFARHPDPRGEQLDAEFAGQGEERARDWGEKVEALRREGCEWSVFCVRRELAGCVFRGEAMPTSEELATRCGRDREEVEGHVKALRADRFAGFPHPNDARQRQLDGQFARVDIWRIRMPLLRQRFSDGTMFRIAREFLAGVLESGALPNQQQVAKLGAVGRQSVRNLGEGVRAAAADLLGE